MINRLLPVEIQEQEEGKAENDDHANDESQVSRRSQRGLLDENGVGVVHARGEEDHHEDTCETNASDDDRRVEWGYRPAECSS